MRRIGVPTLVLHGGSDPLFPLAHGEALAQAVPGASLLVLEGIGHEHPPPATWDLVVPALLKHTEAAVRAGPGAIRRRGRIAGDAALIEET